MDLDAETKIQKSSGGEIGEKFFEFGERVKFCKGVAKGNTHDLLLWTGRILIYRKLGNPHRK